MTDESDDYEATRATAMTLPTWVLRVWEQRARSRVGRGVPTGRERARLLAVRSVLHDRLRR